jgi:hypothetical protein
MNELVSLRFVEDHRKVVVLGPVGVGKTFLANALGHLCCRAGFNVRLLRADALLRLLKQSRMDNSREAVMTELATLDVLIIEISRSTHEPRREPRHLPALRRAQCAPFHRRNQQPRHVRVDCFLRRRTLCPERGRSTQEQRLPSRRRRRVLSIAPQAQHRQAPASAFGSGEEGGRSPRMRSTNTVADGGRVGCYLVGRWSSSKPRDARLKMLASRRC